MPTAPPIARILRSELETNILREETMDRKEGEGLNADCYVGPDKACDPTIP
jgi:hypothetical protein